MKDRQTPVHSLGWGGGEFDGDRRAPIHNSPVSRFLLAAVSDQYPLLVASAHDVPAAPQNSGVDTRDPHLLRVSVARKLLLSMSDVYMLQASDRWGCCTQARHAGCGERA